MKQTKAGTPTSFGKRGWPGGLPEYDNVCMHTDVPVYVSVHVYVYTHIITI